MTGTTLPKTSSLLAAVLLSRVASVVGQDCISDITDIVNAEYEATDFGKLRTYNLCPDTTFDIGIFNDKDFTYSKGQSALEIFQPNLHILCGEDGSVDNNCVFSGGTFHVDVYELDEPGMPPLSNVLVSGITFTGSPEFNVNVMGIGELTFQDCLFTGNMDSLSIIYMEAANPLQSKLTLDGCAFTSNSATFSTEDDLVTALIYNVGQELVVKDCLFQDNTIIPPDGVSIPDEWTTCLVGAFDGSESELDGCCFIDNSNVFAPMYGEDSIYRVDVSRVLSYSSMGDYECAGLAELVELDPFEYNCFPTQGENCLVLPADPTLAPTAAPTKAPTPTVTPTFVPTKAPTPTLPPTLQPTAVPTKSLPPTDPPTDPPTSAPVTVAPTFVPTPGPPSASTKLSHGFGFLLAAAAAAFLVAMY